MRTSKDNRVKVILLMLGIAAFIVFIVYGWVFPARPLVHIALSQNYTEEEDVSDLELHENHPFLQALTNLPRNTSLDDETDLVIVSQRLLDETFVVTTLNWEEGRLYSGLDEIQLVEVSDIPYAFLLIQNPERRVMQFNRERTRQEIFENLRNQNVMTGLYLSSQDEVDNLVIETILEGFILTSFYATENWLYALLTRGAEDKLIWWDGSHLTLAGNFRR